MNSISSVDGAPTAGGRFDPTLITRPDPALLRYYFLVSLLTFIGFPFVIIPLFFKYQTLRYRFDESGVSMSWGILFRREVHLTYRRIQDIHLTRNLFQRWMGLATVGVQTASGSAGPEMSIDGVLQAEQLRDYLYTEMRGAKGEVDLCRSPIRETAEDSAVSGDEVLTLLQEIRDTLVRSTARED